MIRHGVIEYDDQDEWLTETDDGGAAQIVARDVPRWFGLLVVAALAEADSPLGHGTPVPEEAELPSGDARIEAL